MDQTTYLEFILASMKSATILPQQEVINSIFRKLQPFHKHMLLEQSIENTSIYYESLFSEHVSKPDVNKLTSLLLKNPKTPLVFLEHFLNKHSDFFITKNQENIVDFPIEYFPLLFSKTALTPSKMTLCLFKLFQKPQVNKEKISFIMENQKNNFVPYNPDMYYLMLFFSYMKNNAKSKRLRFDAETKTMYYKPFEITKEFIFISELIYQNFDNIFDLIKPHMVKNTYKGQTFENTIINEDDFGFFIDFVSSLLQKEKIEKRFTQPAVKTKVRKI